MVDCRGAHLAEGPQSPLRRPAALQRLWYPRAEAPAVADCLHQAGESPPPRLACLLVHVMCMLRSNGLAYCSACIAQLMVGSDIHPCGHSPSCCICDQHCALESRLATVSVMMDRF